jgi:hypothetical protein
MWHTTRGQRTLSGAEANLVRESLTAMYDALETNHLPADEGYNSGIDAFDRLSPEQQLAMLAVVGEALLCHHVLPPPLTALSEATAAAIFGGLQVMVEAELDTEESAVEDVLDPSTFWRSLLREAVVEVNRTSGHLPEPWSNDWQRWSSLIGLVSGEVLATADWNMEDLVVDSSPEQSAAMKDGLQITDDYFDAIAPDPAGVQLCAVRRRLDALTGLHHSDPEPHGL